MKQGLEDAKAAAASTGAGLGLAGGLFAQPEVLARLTTNPQARLGRPPAAAADAEPAATALPALAWRRPSVQMASW